MEGTESLENNALWKKFDKEIDLYKFYLEISVKSAVFVFGITGALVSYYLSRIPPIPAIALMFPITLNFGFLILYVFSIEESKKLFQSHKDTCSELGLRKPFNMDPLRGVCQILAVLYALAALGVILLPLLSRLTTPSS